VSVLTVVRIIETNLDSVIRAPQLQRDELATFVHRPRFKHVTYTSQNVHGEPTPSRNLLALQAVLSTIRIEDDPYVLSLRQQLDKLQPGPERTRIDQKLSKTMSKQDSYTHKGLRDFARTAEDIFVDLGPWATDWYVAKVVEQAKATASPYRTILSAWQHREKAYLVDILCSIQLTPISYEDEAIEHGVSDKVDQLIDCLHLERGIVESMDEEYSCLIFVTRRDSVLALAEVLNKHPRTKSLFRVGTLLGSSDSSYRRAFLDITRELVTQTQSETLADFRIGEKNVICATAVAEEGIDIQACGTVIRWDPPQNMVSWAQSRGRARRKISTFVLMFQGGGLDAQKVATWEGLEMEMARLYNDDERAKRARRLREEEPGIPESENDQVHRVPSTG
jgi:endoribonuclease Dicer